jgi:hypothetical protein
MHELLSPSVLERLTPARNCNGRRRVSLQWRETSRTHYLASLVFSSLSCMVRRSKMRLGVSCRRSSLSLGTLLLSTGSEHHPNSTAVCLQISLHTTLRRTRYHPYLKMRCRDWSRRCKTLVLELGLKLYGLLDRLSAPRFAHHRLHLPCIAFPVTQIRRRSIEHKETYFTYEVKADGLRDLNITTEDRLPQFSRGKKPSRSSFLLIRPWDRRLLELPDYPDDMESVNDFALPGSSGEQATVDSKSSERAMRLIVRLRQPFSAFMLVQQRGKEYKRIASDRDIITQVKELTV